MKKDGTSEAGRLHIWALFVYNTLTYPENTLSAKVFEIGVQLALTFWVYCTPASRYSIYTHVEFENVLSVIQNLFDTLPCAA